jgi:hypothetical protein
MPNWDRRAGQKVSCTTIQVGHPDSDVLCKEMSPVDGILIVTIFLILVKCYQEHTAIFMEDTLKTRVSNAHTKKYTHNTYVVCMHGTDQG